MREVVRSADKPFLCFRLPYFVIYQGHLLLYHWTVIIVNVVAELVDSSYTYL